MPRKAKKTAITSKSSRDIQVVQTPAIETTSNMDSVSGLVKKKYFSIGVGLVFILLALFFLKSLFVVAFVNGQPVWRYTVVRELEKQGGKQTLNSVVTNILIQQEARKKRITVSDDEIQNQIKTIEKSVSGQGQNLDQLLTMQGMTRKDLEDRIKQQKQIEKLIDKKITVSDQEVQDYIDKNKSTIPEGMSDDQVKQSVKQQLLQQKSSSAYDEYIANLQKNAKILYLVNY